MSLNSLLIITILLVVLLVIGSVMKNKIAARLCRSFLCLLFITVGWAFGMFGVLFLFPAEGIWVVTAACIVAFMICLLFIWKPFEKKTRRRTALILVLIFIVPYAAVSGFQAYHDSVAEVPVNEEFDLWNYVPFHENTRAASLDRQCTLRIRDNLPRMDGATALYPLYAAFARAVYPPGTLEEYDPYKGISTRGPLVICSTTSKAFENLLNGYVDVIFVMDVSDSQWKTAKARELELVLTPIGSEAFVFFVNKHNSMQNLSVADIKNIYSGRITKWSEVGGSNDLIRAYQRSPNSGSQTALEKIMGNTPIMDPPEKDVQDMMMGMYRAVADYKNYKNALGYSFLYYITGMIAEDEVRLLSINNIEPTRENISSGRYPFSQQFYAITVAREPETDKDMARMENTQMLIDWILSSQGQYLVEKTGYLPLAGE